MGGDRSRDGPQEYLGALAAPRVLQKAEWGFLSQLARKEVEAVREEGGERRGGLQTNKVPS